MFFSVLAPLLFLCAIYMLIFRKRDKDNLILKVSGILLFFAYLIQLNFNLAIDQTVGLEGGPLVLL